MSRKSFVNVLAERNKELRKDKFWNLSPWLFYYGKEV